MAASALSHEVVLGRGSGVALHDAGDLVRPPSVPAGADSARHLVGVVTGTGGRASTERSICDVTDLVRPSPLPTRCDTARRLAGFVASTSFCLLLLAVVREPGYAIRRP